MFTQELFSIIRRVLGPTRSFRLAMGPLGRFVVYALGITRKPVVQFVTRYGFRMQTSGYEYYMSGYMFLGETNPSETKVLRSLLHPGDVMIDVGAHIGWFALNAAQQVGKAGRVIAFEPNPHCLVAFRHNVRLSGFQNITIQTSAASDKNGSATFWIGDDMAGSLISGNTQRLTKESVKSLKVELRMLDSFNTVIGKRRLSLIKIDVEGAEVRVLKGAKNLLRRLKPHLILEVQEESLHTAGSSRAELFSLLAALGYLPFLFASDGLSSVSYADIPLDVVNVFFSCDSNVDKRVG